MTVATIDIDHLAGDRGGAVARQKDTGFAARPDRSSVSVGRAPDVLQHLAKAAIPRAAKVFTAPADMQFTRILFGPRS